ncbi:ThuA domain-containing protein [Paenibacillus marinisediminis]
MKKHALIVQGGWDGHQPQEVAELLAGVLQEEGFEVHISNTLDSFKTEDLSSMNLIVPCWTMGEIASDQLEPLLRAVHEHGVGIAGCHGGMGDSFRKETEYQYMVGGQWVAHPGNDGVVYQVHIKDHEHEITAGMQDFTVVSEQYYMHVDPAIHVLADTVFHGHVHMPVAWTKQYGAGKVFYCSLGHQADIVAMPETLGMMRRGMKWAAK